MSQAPNQFRLFQEKRFLPYFITQFLGAFNDNVYKTSLLVLIAITFASIDPKKVNDLNNLGAGLFIFPFFLFSATAGQLADKYYKPSLVRIIKFVEILICITIGIGFYLNNFYFMLSVLFLLGMQAAFFAPVKYSILPQYLNEKELLGGNGLVEMGTFVAILLGTVVGGLLIGVPKWGMHVVTATVILIALCGFIASLLIPPPQKHFIDRNLKINWEPFSQTWRTLKVAAQQPILFWTLIGISWFWFYGSILLTQIPNYTKLYLGGNSQVMTLLLTMAALGIGLGSVLCETICRYSRIDYLKLIPIGALGLTIFTIDISFVVRTLQPAVIDIHAFIHQWKNWHVLIDLFLMGLFGGIYSVPLYVLLQVKSNDQQRSQMVGANSVLNALFMTIASIMAIVLLHNGLSIPQLFLVVGILNGLCTFLIFKKVL